MAKRQRLIAAATLLTVVACSDTDNGTLGPPVTDPSANVTTVDLDGTNAFVSDICGPVDVSSGDLAGTQIASPCDGDFANSDGEFPDADGDGYPDEALDPAKLPFTGATWFLSSIDASPSPTPPNFGGLASRLKVRAFPYPDRDWCEDSANTAGGTGNDCAEFDLPAVVEVTDGAGTSLSYRTDFKTNKKKGGGGAGRYVPAESYWQLVVYFDFDGNNQFADTEDIASRIVKATETPSTDIPLNGWSLDIQRGSNQPVPFVIEDDGGCFGEAVGFQFASCFVDFARGFRIAVLTGDGEGLVLSAGPGNDHVGTQLVSGEVC
ncbi:MAG: hypothetical protein R3195_15415, partial [Gemmatimonadota bacterium]|nr:hypothetical protein [Gemmatimonadota bacterium]